MTDLHGHGLGCERGGRRLFSALDVHARAGEFTVVVGPNGAGKSTLLRGLSGLIELTGTVRVGDTPLEGIAPAERGKRVAFLPQSSPVGLGMTVLDVVALGRLPHRSRWAGPSAHDRERIAACLAQMEIESLRDRQVQSLSGGERQRVMLARLLATDAPVLVLDEPTAALDIGHALALLERLRALAAEGRAVIAALHDVLLADQYADRVICVHGDAQARVSVGPTAQMLSPPRLQEVFGVAFARNAEGHLQLCPPPR